MQYTSYSCSFTTYKHIRAYVYADSLVRHACNIQICVYKHWCSITCVYHTYIIHAVGILQEQRDSREWLQHISGEHMVRNSKIFASIIILTLFPIPPSSVVILAYDVTNEETLEKTRLGGHQSLLYLFPKFSKLMYYLRSWLREAKEFCTSDFKVFLVSTKKDLVVSIQNAALKVKCSLLHERIATNSSICAVHIWYIMTHDYCDAMWSRLVMLRNSKRRRRERHSLQRTSEQNTGLHPQEQVHYITLVLWNLSKQDTLKNKDTSINRTHWAVSIPCLHVCITTPVWISTPH